MAGGLAEVALLHDMKGTNMINNPIFGPLLAEGKTKQIYADPENTDLAYMVSKDAITAGDGVRRNELVGKSRWRTATTANVYRLLNQEQIATHCATQV